MVQWNGKAIHQHEDLDFSVSLPATDEYMKKFIMLPMNTSLTNEEVDYISKKLKNFMVNEDLFNPDLFHDPIDLRNTKRETYYLSTRK